MRGIEYIEGFFPEDIVAFTTSRVGGFSNNFYSSFNLGLHVGDSQENVKKNQLLLTNLLEKNLVWMYQKHTNSVQQVGSFSKTVEADGIITIEYNCGCAVLTADCLPILLSTGDGRVIGALHVGWRGLSSGILENFYSKVIYSHFYHKNNCPLINSIYIWFGPSICRLFSEQN